MGGKHTRVIGTTIEAIEKAEQELGFLFSPSYREWLIVNNGKSIEDITIFPVFDNRDPRKTWDSIVRNFNENWRDWVSIFDGSYDLSNLLPIGEFGSGDYFCFDFSNIAPNGEAAIVLWDHETGETHLVADDFGRFAEMAERGELDY